MGKKIMERTLSRTKAQIICLVFVFFVNYHLFAQDPYFSQPYTSFLYYNPAAAGSWGDLRVSSLLRIEFSDLGVAYNSIFLSADHYVAPIHGGVGISYLYDNNDDGSYKTESANLSYAYHFEFGNNFSAQPAIQVGWLSKELNNYFPDTTDVLQFYGPLNPNGAISDYRNDKFNHFDLSAGFVLYDKIIVTGIAVHHITKPDEYPLGDREGKLPLRIVYHLCYNVMVNSKLFVTPSFLFQSQNKFTMLHGSLALNYSGFVVQTGWYKNFNTDGYALQFKIGSRFENVQIGYSFDAYLSHSEYPFLSTHEASLQFLFNYDKKKSILNMEIMAY